DKDGASSEYTGFVTVTNVAPTAALVNAGPVDEGGTVTITFDAPVDPSPADAAAGFHYAFSCAGDSLAGATYAGSGTSPVTTCSFADSGSHVVRGKIIDQDGGATEYTTAVTVTDVAPTARLEAPATVVEGVTYTLSLEDVADVSPADVAAGFLFAFDCGDGAGYGPTGSDA